MRSPSRCSLLAAVCMGLACGGAAAPSKPNIVFLLTDDQDMRLGASQDYTQWGSVAAQPVVQKGLVDGGAAMSNFFVNTPICCPSRTEFFTGRYFHNVRGAGGAGCMHANTSGVADRKTGLFGRLTSAGYTTGIFGKTTNDQLSQLQDIVKQKSASYISSPVDYNDFFGLRYFNYNASRGDTQGTIETLNTTNPIYGTPYQTTQIGNRSLEWLDDVVHHGDLPFFMYLGPHAPHYPAAPAPWYEDEFAGLKAPRTPNYDAASPGKADHIQQNPPLSEDMQCWEDQHFRDRWRSLLSVDDLVAAVLAGLERHGLLDSTFFVYSSDHGYKLGQWRVPTSKQHPYETDIRVPLFVRGPGITEGSVLPDVTGNVDLFPTLMSLAGHPVAEGEVDGREFASRLLGTGGGAEVPRRTAWLNEYESTGDLWSDHSTVWVPQNFTGCGGRALPTGPSGVVNHSLCVEGSGVGDGLCYFIDSVKSNNFRALRRINATHDTQYIEVAGGWDWEMALPVHYEYYNLTSDPYQLHNSYGTLDQATRDALALELDQYYACKGETCP